MEKIETEKAADEMLDVPKEFHPVILKYGREMYALLMSVGMAAQATEVLAIIVDKHKSSHGAHAVGVLSSAFNEVSTAYCKLKGWDEGMLAQCDRDIQLTFAGKVQTPGNVMLLNS